MSSLARSALTLAGLTLVLVLAGWWAWSAVTAPLPGEKKGPACTVTPVSEGDKVYPADVTVNVTNAGDRNGLASDTLNEFSDAGFDPGSAGNAPDKVDVSYAQIWTSEPRNPAVRLVASRLGKGVEIVKKADRGTGVVVVVGDGFAGLAGGKESVTASYDTEICSPTG
jgi:hypothetical protein